MGTVVISVDAELGWGFHDLSAPPAARVEAGREGWQRLVALFDEYDVPATWAVVGHLYQDDCDGEHADHPLGPNWFARERESWRDRPDLRFGRSLVQAVRDADADHELGCHTYSHALFDDIGPAAARAELERSVDLAREFGADARSFVFPRNRPGNYDAVADAGFDCYRGANPDPDSAAQKLAGALTRPRVPPLVQPTVDDNGLVAVPASLCLYGFEGWARATVAAVRGDPVVRQVEVGLDAAATLGGVLHLWLHPNNLVGRPERERMDRVLAAVARRRDEGDVTVATMGEVADRTLAALT